jgi:hypothetical protein
VVQNTLARVVTGRRKFDHITPVLRELHWLPVGKRVTFKIATLMFMVLHTGEPGYLASLIPAFRPRRELRSSSSSQDTIDKPRVRTVTASRAFRHAGPSVWNSLPPSVIDCTTINTFRTHLKTHLLAGC